MPNFSEFVRVVLKQEKLSEEAEAWRLRYETSIRALEEAVEKKEPDDRIPISNSTAVTNEGKGVCVILEIMYINYLERVISRGGLLLGVNRTLLSKRCDQVLL